MFGPTNDKEVPAVIVKLVDRLHQRALEHLKHDKEIEPLIFFFKTDPEQADGIGPHVGVLPVGPLMNSVAGKRFVEFVMEDTIKEDQVDIVILMTEAWVAPVSAEQAAQLEEKPIRASEHPDKQEVVLFNIMTKSKQFLGSATIKREPIRLEPVGIVPIDTDEGTSGNLVRQKKEKPIIH